MKSYINSNSNKKKKNSKCIISKMKTLVLFKKNKKLLKLPQIYSKKLNLENQFQNYKCSNKIKLFKYKMHNKISKQMLKE